MQIQQESQENHTIQAYDETCIKINDISYTQSFVVSPDKIISPWPVSDSLALTEQAILQLLELNPEIVLVGTAKPHIYQSSPLFLPILQKHIGVECISLGAACRTFNVLLSEHRHVVAGFILP